MYFDHSIRSDNSRGIEIAIKETYYRGLEMSNLRTLELAVEIVSTFVVTNKITAKALPELIGVVHEALEISTPVPSIPLEKRTPAVAVGKSVTPDYIICLEDGRRYKSMRHHLKRLGMTPEEYRKKWGLAVDYPVVAPNFAARRSELATKQKLGHWRVKTKAAEPDNKQTSPPRPRNVSSKAQRSQK
jgi:predicted transcriptional regulator